MGLELRTRWNTPEGRVLTEEVFARLVAGRPLGDLGLDAVDGRVDLRGLPAPLPRRLRRFEADGWFIEQLGGLLEFRGGTLEGIDLSSAQLDSLRFFDVRFEDCLFEGSRCQDWRLWGCELREISFARADLRGSSLGAWHNGRGVRYLKVDFSEADLRGVSSTAATYVDSTFAQTRLDKVNFHHSSFMRCRFSGPLREVIFDGRQLSTGKPDRNRMEDVDFTGAELQLVEFRGLDLDRVTLPADSGLRFVEHYPCVLRAAVEALEGRNDGPARVVRAVLANRQRYLAPDQRRGLFNRGDFLLMGGEAEAELADNVVRQAEADCMP